MSLCVDSLRDMKEGVSPIKGEYDNYAGRANEPRVGLPLTHTREITMRSLETEKQNCTFHNECPHSPRSPANIIEVDLIG